MNGGCLTQEMITAALDEMWYGRHGPIPSPRNSEGALIYPGGNLPPLFCGIPELDWTVSAGGWKLVIENGAIEGIIRDM